MHIFRSRENIKTCIFTAVKIQGLIFSRDRNHFFLFSQYGLREATLCGISVSFLRETTIGVFLFLWKCKRKQKVKSLRSLIKGKGLS